MFAYDTRPVELGRVIVYVHTVLEPETTKRNDQNDRNEIYSCRSVRIQAIYNSVKHVSIFLIKFR